MNDFLRKTNWPELFLAGVLFFLFSSGTAWAYYSGHVASFKNEKNAVVFVHKMKAKGLLAFYQKEDVPGKGEFFRAYIGKYKTTALAQKALAGMKKSGKIGSFSIRETVEENKEIEFKEEIVAQKSEPVHKPESKIEAVAKVDEPVQKPEGETKSAEQKGEPARKSENKVETLAKAEPVQKPAEQKTESLHASENKTETIAKTEEPVQKPEGKVEPEAQKNEPAQKRENKIETVAKTEKPPVKNPAKKEEPAVNKTESVQKSESKESPSIDTSNYYKGIKGIVLKNGRTIKGKILSIDENDVLKIRTRSGRILSYSFTRDVKEYITESEP